MYGIYFNGSHSYYDMGYTMPLEDREIGFPSKEKILVRVPFSNVEYDFSQLYGSQTYTPRTLTYVFNVLKRGNWTHKALESEKTRLINWLMNTRGKRELYDDDIPGYYFLAEVESEASFVDDYETGTLTVQFKAYPFMISMYPEGNDIWDTFNFDLDVSQPVDFTVNGSLSVLMLNTGTPDVVPEIITSSEMEIYKDGVTYIIPEGYTKNSDFVFESGGNRLEITGNGTISFVFYKELI